jgi:hypothetical protein
MAVSRKVESGTIDGTPEKRLFWSIISDYDLRTAICELIDNALDLWVLSKGKKAPTIEVNLDVDRQIIRVCDTAGGIGKADLRLLLSPGGSKNDPAAQIIGIFGVGSKRAVIALGERVELRTRVRGQSTFQIDITKEWLESADWEMALYEVPDIDPDRTEIDITQLRRALTDEDVAQVTSHLSEVYSSFIHRGCSILVNGAPVNPSDFALWAYPPEFPPRTTKFQVASAPDGVVTVSISAGLILDRDPEGENYGVYFYCNDRLIVGHLKTRDVGYFVAGEAGVPHPDASLARVIVQMEGPAKLMPWNSSKSNINPAHPIFRAIRPTVIQLGSYYSSLSRRLKDDWPRAVFSHKSGEQDPVTVPDPKVKNPVVLPPLPKTKKLYVQTLTFKNRKQVADRPWTLGLIESIAAVDILGRQKLETKNRIALVLLDSTFEIALKEFIVHRNDLFPQHIYNDAKIAQLFARRHDVIREVKPKVSIAQTVWDKAQHYYSIRNKVIHERATVSVADSDIANYRKTITQVLSKLFDLKF